VLLNDYEHRVPITNKDTNMYPNCKIRFLFQPDDSVVCAGMSDGLVQFLHRKVPPTLAEREEEKLRKKSTHRYLQFTHFTPQTGDIVVKQVKQSNNIMFLFF
jgi:hypothetical protein